MAAQRIMGERLRGSRLAHINALHDLTNAFGSTQQEARSQEDTSAWPMRTRTAKF